MDGGGGKGRARAHHPPPLLFTSNTPPAPPPPPPTKQTNILYRPAKVCYNPQKGPVSEPVRVDLVGLLASGDGTPGPNSDGCRRRLLRRL